MLFWIFVAMLAIGIGCIVVYNKTRADEWVDYVGLGLNITAIAGIVISLVIMLCAYCGVDGDIAANQARYDSLVYQYENNVYDNDNDLGKRELYKEIQEWNEGLAWNKVNQDSFWIGIYIPNVYDQFEFIELNQQ